MMETANLENCKKLHELSGWENTHKVWSMNLDNEFFAEPTCSLIFNKGKIPAYDSGYLLRKLPAQFGKRGSSSAECLRIAKDSSGYLAGYIGVDLVWGYPSNADTPEDALCLLAIKLFEEGILNREAKTDER